MDQFDVCIVGAGVIGLAIAQRLSRESAGRELSIVLLDRNAGIGHEISSRNSEVIHAGIYYPQDSLKASLCTRGRELLYQHCLQYNVPFRRTGKHIVASGDELGRLEQIAEQALLNGVSDLRWLSSAELGRSEPAVRAERALFSPSTGIVDSHGFMLSLLHQAEAFGVCFAGLTRVEHAQARDDGFIVDASCGRPENPEPYRFHSRVLINSAGLAAQSLASRIEGLDPAIVPPLYYCKGDYYSLSGKSPFSSLIYPVPEKDQKGLGVHATLDMAGQVRFGPDAEYIDSLDFKVDDSRRQMFCNAIRRYFPALDAERLQPDYSGIRPKLVDAGQGFADFEIQDEKRHGFPGLIQLFGIESPGLTASLALAELVRDKLKPVLEG